MVDLGMNWSDVSIGCSVVDHATETIIDVDMIFPACFVGNARTRGKPRRWIGHRRDIADYDLYQGVD